MKMFDSLKQRLDKTLHNSKAKQAAAYSKAAEYSVLVAAQLILSAREIRKDLDKED